MAGRLMQRRCSASHSMASAMVCNGEIWGGEFLLADYRRFERLATFKPVAMLGGDQASREPWRNLYAHLMAEMGWANFAMNFGDLDVYRALERQTAQDPRCDDARRCQCAARHHRAGAYLMLPPRRWASASRVKATKAKRQRGSKPSLTKDASAAEDGTLDYPFTIPRLKGINLPYIEPVGVWNAILGDLILKTPPAIMSARFHRGLARAICAMAVKLAQRDSEAGPRFDTVALSGGCFHNRILLEQVIERLQAEGFNVLTHSDNSSRRRRLGTRPSRDRRRTAARQE